MPPLSVCRSLDGSLSCAMAIIPRKIRQLEGHFEQLHQPFADAYVEHLLIDSTIIRAHPCSAGARKSGGQALGRRRGGFSIKIHIAVDALSNLMRLILTPGQRHDSPQAGTLIDSFEPQVLIVDKYCR
jgi:hypothetical protein